MEENLERYFKDMKVCTKVSNLGRVKSLGRSGKGCSLEDRVLKPMINDDGYELVNLKSSNHIAK